MPNHDDQSHPRASNRSHPDSAAPDAAKTSDAHDPRGKPIATTGTSGQPSEAKRELFEAIDHLKHAASLFFDRATQAPAVKGTRERLEHAIESASEKADSWSERVDPAFEAAGKEAERVIGKIGATAEPLVRQVTGELKELTQKFSGALGGRKRRPPPAPEEE